MREQEEEIESGESAKSFSAKFRGFKFLLHTNLPKVQDAQRTISIMRAHQFLSLCNYVADGINNGTLQLLWNHYDAAI